MLAETHWLAGDGPRARAYADSARMILAEEAREAPGDPGARVGLGVALAYLGRKPDAIREGERCAALLPNQSDAITVTELQYQLVELYVLVDEPEKALDYLEPLLKRPSWLSAARLRIDPSFEPLRGNPRFERVVSGM